MNEEIVKRLAEVRAEKERLEKEEGVLRAQVLDGLRAEGMTLYTCQWGAVSLKVRPVFAFPDVSGLREKLGVDEAGTFIHLAVDEKLLALRHPELRTVAKEIEYVELKARR